MPTTLRRILVEHPVAWGLFAVAFFAYVSRLPINGWNVEILIARNLLRGHGFVVGPMDPPALWRPPLAVLALVPIEAFVEDPKMVYKVFTTLCLTVTTLAVFYLMKRVGGVVAAHVSQLFVFTVPASTTLVNQQPQMLSYVIMYATVATAILLTLDAWRKSSRARDAVVGLAWGVAFLSRPEVSVLFGATLVCSFFAYRGKAKESVPVWHRLFIQAACFLLIYAPAGALFQHLQREHDLIGQEPLVTYYAGEYLASSTPTGDPDGQGYVESLRRFGEPAVYHYSLIRFALAQPAAVLTRIRQNIGNAITLFASGTVVRPADWLLFLIFGAVLARSTPPAIPGRQLLLYSALLSAASTYFLLFHADPRYTLAFVLMLLVSVQFAAILLWQWIGRMWPQPALAPSTMAICATVLVGLFAFRVSAAVATAHLREVDVTPFRTLADSFRTGVGPSGTPSVGYSPPDADAMWISYFAGTSIPWHVDSTVFPRDRIYSFKNRAEEYLLAPASTNLRDWGNPPILWRGIFDGIGDYICVDLRGRSSASP